MDRFERMVRRRDEYQRRKASGPDSMAVRLELLDRVQRGEMTLEDAQREIRRLAKVPFDG